MIYRVAQESVANALRHAETTQLSIAVARTGDRVAVTVANQGTMKPAAAEVPGLGLVSMRERVQAADGSLHIERASEGWTVTASFGAGRRSNGRMNILIVDDHAIVRAGLAPPS